MKKQAAAKVSWRNTGFFKSMASNVPSESGVYVISHINRAMGLPTSVDVLYVGKARNLRRRFLDHVSPWREHNKGLLTMHSNKDLEFWFTEFPDEQIDQLEKDLIRASNPSQNIVRYGEGK